MAIRTPVREIAVHSDPLSFVAEISVLAGNPVQCFNKDLGKYIPDRFADKEIHQTLIAPYVSVSDPENMQSGIQPIVECAWYEGHPGLGKRIADSENYHINNPKAEGYNPDAPDWSLDVMKNFEPDKPMEIYAVFSFLDVRRNELVSVERSIVFRTTFFDLDMFTLQLQDTPAHQRIDPLRVVPNEKGAWLSNFSAQLYSGYQPVADKDAAYWWQVFENGQWRNFTEDERKVFVSGDTTKTVTIDTKFVQLLRMRCIAAPLKGTRPAMPTSTELVVTTYVKVEFSKFLRVDLRQTAGMKISPTLRTPCSFIVDIEDKDGEVPREKDYLFSIKWMIKSERPGSVPVVIGGGRELNFIPSEVKMDLEYKSAVSAEVELHTENGLVAVGGAVLKLGESYLSTSKFE